MESTPFKAGFVNIFGPPNSGKSTLMNLLLGEKLSIVSPKVQTTRHRILGFLTEKNYQIIFSDTPGIIDPQYKLHHKMMQQVKNAVEDTDIALFMTDVQVEPTTFATMMEALQIKTKKILIINKIDLIKDVKELDKIIHSFQEKVSVDHIIPISALKGINTYAVLETIIQMLPQNPPFFPEEDISNRSTRFFVSEMIREQIYFLYDKEVPYHTAVLIQSFEELPHITRISADIIVTRETQKMILLGSKGMLIKKLGMKSRERIEEFLEQKVYLELFVKVRPKWRDNENYLKEYGY